MRWQVLGSSIRGTQHVKEDRPCQDAHHWADLGDGVLVLAVADGAGSAPLADVGAALAARQAVDSVARQLGESPAPSTASPDDAHWKNIVRRGLIDARGALEAEAASRGVRPADLACTLILVLARNDLVAAAQVGDGAAILEHAGQQLTALTVPRAGEYINETTFLVSAQAIETAQLAVWHGQADFVALLTDGLQSLAMKFPKAIPHAPFFRPLFNFAAAMSDGPRASEQLAQFLASPKVTARTEDDLTLLIASAQNR